MTQPRVHAPSARLGRDLAVGDLLVAWDRRVTSIEETPARRGARAAPLLEQERRPHALAGVAQVTHPRERVSRALLRIAGALYSLACRVELSGALCPDCQLAPDRGEDVPCPVCEELRARRDVEAAIYDQGYAQACRDSEEAR